MNKPAFTRAWRLRMPGRNARNDRRRLKRACAKHRRRLNRQEIRAGYEVLTIVRLSSWEVI